LRDSAHPRGFFFRERAARREAEHGRANEALLRQQAEARAAIGQAAALLGESPFSAADQLLTRVNFPESGLGGEAVFRPLGEWAAAEGLWLRAAEYFKLLFRVDQMQTPDVATLDSTRCAVALIKAGDEPGYDQFRRDIIERFGGTRYPVDAERALKNSLLLPPDKTIMTALAPLADLAMKAVPVDTPHGRGGAVAGRYRLALCFPGSVELSPGRLRGKPFVGAGDVWLTEMAILPEPPPPTPSWPCPASSSVKRRKGTMR
jgi:hypothetical protein